MARQSPAQQKTIARVMHEFKQGELEQRNGAAVENPKQAIAIALHEAGASNQESPAKNRRNLARTKRREKAGTAAENSRAALYAEAKRRDLPGRSKMSKAELERALDA